MKDKTTDIKNQDRDTAVENIYRELTSLRSELIAAVDQEIFSFENIDPNYRESARNLLHYLALRRRDLRPLQQRLAALGLSSLGRAESHVLATVDAVLNVVEQLLQREGQNHRIETPGIDFKMGE